MLPLPISNFFLLHALLLPPVEESLSSAGTSFLLPTLILIQITCPSKLYLSTFLIFLIR